MTRMARALISNRPAVNSTGNWANQGGARWRTASANPAEVRTRMWQTLAQGGCIHLHWLGFDQGFHEDRRWQQNGLDVLPFQQANDRHFHNVRSIADVAMVVSPRNNRVYSVPPGSELLDSFHGAYKILTEQRIPFDFVLDSELSYDVIGRYPVLVLANIAAMDDKQAAQIRDYVARGGSILATFETGLYDETGKPRSDFALADLFGMHAKGPRLGYGANAGPGVAAKVGSPSTQRIEQSHPIVESFKNTTYILGSSWRVPISTSGAAILTDIPQHPGYPVEAVFPKTSHTAEQTLVAREVGQSRLVYVAGDIEAGYWRSSAGDLGDLIAGAFTRDQRPLKVEGVGLLETTAFQTEVGYAVHLVNHTNPNFRGGAFREVFAVGPQKVTLTATSTKPIRSARLLRAGAAVPFKQEDASIEVTVPGVGEYEVVAFEV
jgi:hypothetical protein